MTFIKAITSSLLIGAAALASAAQASTQNPDLYVVMFRADWCGPCKIVEPNINNAMKILKDPSIEVVNIDITNPSLSEIGAHRAFDREIVPQYNNWLGITGFAAIIDADTKNTLGCVNMMYDAQSMARHIGNLKTFADANQPTEDITCPGPAPRT